MKARDGGFYDDCSRITRLGVACASADIMMMIRGWMAWRLGCGQGSSLSEMNNLVIRKD